MAGTPSIQPGARFDVGLHFTLEKGWHIYWINPGDAGEPPRVKWNLPPGLAAGEIQWPVPKPLPAYSTMDFGYEEDVLLIVPIKVATSAKPGSAVLNADLRLIVCRDVCIPAKAQLTLDLPVERHAASENPAPQTLFAKTKAQLPQAVPSAWRFRATEDKDSLHLIARTGARMKEAFFFPLDANQIENAAPQKLVPSSHGFDLILKKSNQLLKPVSTLKGVLRTGGRGYTINIPVMGAKSGKTR